MPPRALMQAGHAATHGRCIYIYNHVMTGQTLYSLDRLLNNSHLEQLAFAGKKTIPAGIRKDLWRPLVSVTFPHAAQGLLAFRKLREFKKLHELAWSKPESSYNGMIDLDDPYAPKPEPRPNKKERSRLIMNQKANTIADLAAVLRGPEDTRRDVSASWEKAITRLHQQARSKMHEMEKEARDGRQAEMRRKLGSLKRDIAQLERKTGEDAADSSIKTKLAEMQKEASSMSYTLLQMATANNAVAKGEAKYKQLRQALEEASGDAQSQLDQAITQQRQKVTLLSTQLDKNKTDAAVRAEFGREQNMLRSMKVKSQRMADRREILEEAQAKHKERLQARQEARQGVENQLNLAIVAQQEKVDLLRGKWATRAADAPTNRMIAPEEQKLQMMRDQSQAMAARRDALVLAKALSEEAAEADEFKPTLEYEIETPRTFYPLGFSNGFTQKEYIPKFGKVRGIYNRFIETQKAQYTAQGVVLQWANQLDAECVPGDAWPEEVDHQIANFLRPSRVARSHAPSEASELSELSGSSELSELSELTA